MKTRKLGLFFGAIGVSVLLLSALAQPAAALCTPAQTATNLVGDDYYMCGGPGYSGWQCNQAMISNFWNGFGFGSDDSWENRGYDDPCNNSMKLAQTFNALAVLGYAHTYSPNCDTNLEHVALGGLCYAGNQINKLRARISDDDGNLASTGSGLNNRQVTLYNNFFTQDVGLRAGTIFHEARHADGCGHNAEDRNCYRKASCDKSWENGCPAAGNDAGANRYQVTFLRAYGVSPHSTGTLRLAALQKANVILRDAFRDDPCFRFDLVTGAAVDWCN
jgi:hypothetical protein